MTRRILLLNVNTTASVTATLAAAARQVAAPGTEIVATEPAWGTSAVEGYYDGFVSVAACLDRLHALLGGADPALGPPWSAVVWAGFGDPGREAVQELLDVPVITLAEAAAHMAGLLGHRYGVVTTLARSCPQIEDALRAASLYERCAAIVPAGVAVLDAAGSATVLDRLTEAGQAALEAGAEVLCLGSGALAGLAGPLAGRLGVPVVDSVQAAVALAEACCALGLTTSKYRAYAAPLPKARPGWPPAAHRRGDTG
ncbi:aspartate/glutamate racemase family protein [Actinacidiphila oryziradicis]|jgi:allantoin racemase|uniref:aspartate/glutamate racemase family protein n=1 Tax=Actinacidiphila oryziradicis TaxID=2571141 RepID=UPI0023F22BCF|nr:aspartate/glutamate racemase family protein [Actinacidiphila oryziradicis]MCW2869638.1 Hydantoin racemase [Actinacidiphila oryziradicis]